MRIGLIGDVHAESRALQAALDYFASVGVSLTLCTGDIVDGRGSVDECCQLLKHRQVHTVRGNHERWLLGTTQLVGLPDATDLATLQPQTVAFLRSLPATLEFQTPLGSLLLCHGLGENDMASVKAHDSGYALEVNEELHSLERGHHSIVVNGHTHHALVRHFSGVTIINAGTMKWDDGPCCLVIDCDARSVSRFELSTNSTLVETDAWMLDRVRDSE